MSSFLQKLRRKGRKGGTEETDAEGQANIPEGATQLPVDVYQSNREIIIYAQISGVDLSQLDVSIEGENDIITIQGDMCRPEESGFLDEIVDTAGPQEYHSDDGSKQVQINIASTAHNAAKGEFSFEECIWGPFFRQIILPQEIDPGRAIAKAKDGILVLHLPLKGSLDNRIKMKITEPDHH